MSVPIYNMTATWNNAGTTYDAIKMNVTDTGHAVDSTLLNLQIGGSSYANIAVHSSTQVNLNLANVASGAWQIGRSGSPTLDYSVTNINEWSLSGGGWMAGTFSMGIYVNASSGNMQCFSTGKLGFTSGSANGTFDAYLTRDGAGILSQRDSTNAQTLRVYNTYTDASNYERGVFDWTTNSNVLTIATQSLGTGSARGMRIQCGSGVPMDFYTGSTLMLRMTDSNASLDIGAHAIIGNASGVGFGGTSISVAAAGVVAFGNGSAGDSTGAIKAMSKAGAFTTSDVPSGTWLLGRDTSGGTTKLYYNNAGALMTAVLT